MRTQIVALLGLVCIGWAAHADDSSELTITIGGEKAQMMLANSQKTEERAVVKQSVFKINIDKTYQVYSFDSNWKCYKFDSAADSLTKQIIRGAMQDFIHWPFCVYKLGQNVGGPVLHPEKQDVTISAPGVVQRLIGISTASDVQTLHFPNAPGKQNIEYRHFVAKDWDCYKMNALDDIIPGLNQGYGQPTPREFCTYTSPMKSAAGSAIVPADAGK